MRRGRTRIDVAGSEFHGDSYRTAMMMPRSCNAFRHVSSFLFREKEALAGLVDGRRAMLSEVQSINGVT